MNDRRLQNQIVTIRREIHMHPELGNSEFRTAKLVEKVLRSLRIPSRRVGATGVVARITGAGRGSGLRCIALRADMDALPLAENGKKSYRSRNRGVMHACGHDAHVAMLLGAALLLSGKRSLPGTVKLFFQPNEEGAGGARSLIKGGAMKSPKVDAIVGLHVNPRLPSGSIGIKDGPLMAAVDRLTIRIRGRGGHAAYPHEGRDAISIASEAVQALQTVASRKVDPLEPFVLTIGTFNGGSRYNILAEEVVMTGTVRTLSEKVHRQAPGLISQVLDGVCQAHGGVCRLDYQRLGSVLSNSKSVADLSRRTAIRLFGRRKVVDLTRASMGGEDFSEYLRHSPGCFIYIGTGNRSLGTTVPWHHPGFDIDESALPTGAKLLAGVAEDFLTGR